MTHQSFGMMDQGYFVSRNQLLSWINMNLQTNEQHIENLGSGIIYCKLIQKWNPGIILLNKLNVKAKYEYQFIDNLKLLQSAFFKLGISKPIDIKKLSKCKYQDNLEFIQWLRLYLLNKSGSTSQSTITTSKRYLTEQSHRNYQIQQNCNQTNNTKIIHNSQKKHAKSRKNDENEEVVQVQEQVLKKLKYIKNIMKQKLDNPQKIQQIKKILQY